jgi:hypothetical protein
MNTAVSDLMEFNASLAREKNKKNFKKQKAGRLVFLLVEKTEKVLKTAQSDFDRFLLQE